MGPLRLTQQVDPQQRWVLPLLGGVRSCLPSAPPYPSFPALCRQDTTSWNTDDREYNPSGMMPNTVTEKNLGGQREKRDKRNWVISPCQHDKHGTLTLPTRHMPVTGCENQRSVTITLANTHGTLTLPGHQNLDLSTSLVTIREHVQPLSACYIHAYRDLEKYDA